MPFEAHHDFYHSSFAKFVLFIAYKEIFQNVTPHLRISEYFFAEVKTFRRSVSVQSYFCKAYIFNVFPFLMFVLLKMAIPI